MKLALVKVVAAFALAAAPAEAADRGFPFPFPRPFPAPFPAPIPPRVTIGTPRFSITFGGADHCRPRHVHCFQTVCEREWIAPLYDRRIVAYDCHRRPIWDRVVVRRGYWTTVRYRVCACGERTRC